MPAGHHIPLLNLLLVGAGPVALHPRLHQWLHTTIPLLTSTPPNPSIIVLSSNIHTGNVESACPETVHAWMQAAWNGNVDALLALFQLHSIVSSMVHVSSQPSSTVC